MPASRAVSVQTHRYYSWCSCTEVSRYTRIGAGGLTHLQCLVGAPAPILLVPSELVQLHQLTYSIKLVLAHQSWSFCPSWCSCTEVSGHAGIGADELTHLQCLVGARAPRLVPLSKLVLLHRCQWVHWDRCRGTDSPCIGWLVLVHRS